MSAIANPQPALSKSRRRLLIVAVMIGMFSAALMFLYVNQVESAVTDAAGQPVEIVMAATNISRGTVLQRNHVSTKMVPSSYLPPNPLYPNDLNLFIGQTTSVNIESGAMILTSDFVTEVQSNKLSMRIPPDQRAFTLAVDGISGIAGLLAPGDRVDLIYTLPVSTDEEVIEEDGKRGEGYVTMTLVQNVTLLAVGSQLSEHTRPDHGPAYGSVTVLVSPDEVELLTISQTRGKLGLSLRGPEDFAELPYQKQSLRDVLKRLDLIQRPARKRECVKWGPEVMMGDGITRKKCLTWR